MLLPWKTDLRD